MRNTMTLALWFVLFGGVGAGGSRAADPVEAARRFLRESAPRVAADPSMADKLHLVKVVESLGGIHVRFEQVHEGVPVLGSHVSVHMGRDLDPQLVVSNHVQLDGEAARVPAARVSAQAAVVRATSSLGDGTESLAKPSVVERIQVEGGRPRRIWSVGVAASRPRGDWEIVVDASTGAVISRTNRLKSAEGHGRVFDPNPVVTLRNNRLKDRNDSNAAVTLEAYKVVVLQGLDGSGRLRGEYADTTPTPRPALSRDLDFQYLRKDRRFEQVMAYHHIDRVQRYVRSLGFTNVRAGVQKANCHAHAEDNSYYYPETKRIEFGDGGVDDAEDADTIVHEYGHAIQDDQVPNFGESKEGAAMGEGFGDYLATSVKSDQVFQIECLMSWDGIVDATGEPSFYRRMDSTKHYPEDMVGEEHDDGEIWAACLWQLNRAIGAEIADRLILEHHFLLSPQSRFLDAVEALRLSDRNLYGGAHEDVLRKIFTDRGVLRPAVTSVTIAPGAPRPLEIPREPLPERVLRVGWTPW